MLTAERAFGQRLEGGCTSHSVERNYVVINSPASIAGFCNAGAADFLNKSQINANVLERSIRYALQHKRTEEDLRRNRLALLASIQKEFSRFADFSEIVVEKEK